MTEDQLLTGPLEKTNEPYAIAKIAAPKQRFDLLRCATSDTMVL